MPTKLLAYKKKRQANPQKPKHVSLLDQIEIREQWYQAFQTLNTIVTNLKNEATDKTYICFSENVIIGRKKTQGLVTRPRK